MPNIFKVKRGLEGDRTSLTPAEGELLYTTDEKKIYIGDGATAGGTLIGPGGGAVVYEQTTEPSTWNTGDFWIKTST